MPPSGEPILLMADRQTTGGYAQLATVITADLPLAPLTTLGVGGPASWYLRATSIQHIRDAWQWALDRQQPVLLIGGGSNLVIADEGWRGLVLHVAIGGVTTENKGGVTLLTCGAGVVWDDVVASAVASGLSGIECLSGIPGTVGGTPIQNVGAYGQEVASVIEHVDVFDRTAGRVERLPADGCGFAYRTSRFKGADAGRFIVCEVTFRLSHGPATVSYPDVVTHMREHAIMTPTVTDVRDAVLAIRRRKGMVLDQADPDTRSVGSFFTNPVLSPERFAELQDSTPGAVPSFPVRDGLIKVPAAWLIEHAGFSRGFADGAVGLSTKHPLAIVNRGGASAREVVAFAVRIKRQVAERFGVALMTEPVFAGFTADPQVAYLTGAA